MSQSARGPAPPPRRYYGTGPGLQPYDPTFLRTVWANPKINTALFTPPTSARKALPAITPRGKPFEKPEVAYNAEGNYFFNPFPKPPSRVLVDDGNPFTPTAEVSIGISVRNTQTRHTVGKGVLVDAVHLGGPCSFSRLHKNDIIKSVEGVPLCTADEFRYMLNTRKGLPLRMRINRDGQRNLPVTVYP